MVSVIQLLIPNFNISTLIGIFLIVIGFIALIQLKMIIPKMYSWLSILVGIILIWGVSMFQDFWNDEYGKIIIIALGVIVLVGFMIFYEPKKKK